MAPFQPLLDAAEGEWARYAALGERELHYEVVEVNTTLVRTRVTVRDGGMPVGLPAIREDPRGLDALALQAKRAGAERRQAVETVKAAGQQWNATLYEDRWTDEGVSYIRRTWVGAEAPVFGTVRMELSGDGELEASLELVDWGPRPGGRKGPE